MKEVIAGQRSTILQGANLIVYPLPAMPPKELVNSEEVRGRLLVNPYYLKSHAGALVESSSNLSSLLHLRINYLSLKVTYMSKNILSKPSYDDKLNMAILDAGVSELVAAPKFQKRVFNCQNTWKTLKNMGCWNTVSKLTSPVTITEETCQITLKLPYSTEYLEKSKVLGHENGV